MYRETAGLVMYGQLGKDSILMKLGSLVEKMEHDDSYSREELVRAIYDEVYRLLDLSTTYGFDNNLWQCYIAYLLATTENPFSILCETVGASKDGTVNEIVKQDMEHFYRLFHYDFSEMEKKLGVACFETLTHYHSMAKAENTYNKSVSEKVRDLASQLCEAKNGEDFFDIVTAFYKRYGVGKFGLNKAFRVVHTGDEMVLSPITHTSDVTLDELIGYELQKKQLVENTEAFVEGRRANNCLLFGDSGTGKSTCIKAILNQYYEKGLRLIEVYKHQFQDLNDVIAQIKNRNYKFIIYMDDLSFEEFEIEYKYLKAVIEGGLERKPENVLIYATSNRRHLIREKFSDKEERRDDLHTSDTVQEKLSLAYRFGLKIYFGSPSKKEFQNIVRVLADKHGITMSEEELFLKANQWELQYGGLSGRTAQQFIDHLLGQERKDV